MPGKKKTAAYMQIYNRIRNAIFSGKYPPGAELPSESMFCKEYDVSRETVRKALMMLENERLIFSRPKIGYFVSIPNQEDILIEAEKTEALSLKYKDVRGILPDEKLCRILGIESTQKVIVFAQVVCGGEVPLVYEKKYVPYRKAYPSVESEMRYAVLPDMTLSKVASFDYYIKVMISAQLMNSEVAGALHCPEGTPVLLTEQIFILQDGRIIGYSEQYSAPDQKYCGISGHKK